MRNSSHKILRLNTIIEFLIKETSTMDLKEKIVSSYVAFEDGVNINSRPF